MRRGCDEVLNAHVHVRYAQSRCERSHCNLEVNWGVRQQRNCMHADDVRLGHVIGKLPGSPGYVMKFAVPQDTARGRSDRRPKQTRLWQLTKALPRRRPSQIVLYTWNEKVLAVCTLRVLPGLPNAHMAFLLT